MNNLFLSLLFVLYCPMVIGQISDYDFKRKVENPEKGWHIITLPDEVYSKLETDFFDIRIMGFTESDTMEAPFLVYSNIGDTHFKQIDFEVINRSKKDDRYFYTFKVEPDETVNEIKLNFDNENFDWRVRLEGSNDQKEWFEILDDYRILSISNELDNYEFSTLKFPYSQFNYYRVSIVSDKDPKLTRPGITKLDVDSGKSKIHRDMNFEVSELREEKVTEIEVRLVQPKLVNNVTLGISSQFDYYRPIEVICITDSMQTEKGWIYNKKRVFSGILSSVEPKSFSFNPVITNRVKIRVRNGDNQPLDINNVILKGNIVELITRITDDGEYYLFYGNKNAVRPNYDIAMFKDKIPENPSKLSLGDEETQRDIQLAENPIYDKVWLWIIMAILVIVLGAYTLKMMRK